MKPFNNYGVSSSLNNRTKPTHFVTISLNKSISEIGPDGVKRWIPGDDTRFEGAALAFIASVSKSFIALNRWKRFKPSLPTTGAIEGGGFKTPPHVHLSIRKPAGVSNFHFELRLREKARGNRWFKDGPFSIKIQRLAAPSDGLQAIGYSLKEGLSRALIAG